MSGAGTRLIRAAGLATVLLLPSPCSHAQDLFLSDLMDHRISITAGFTGTDVFIYGVKQGPGDVVVVLRGPPVDYAVRRKERIAGIWLNTDRVDFPGVPSFYAIASSKPLDEVMTAAVQAREEVGVGRLKIAPAEDAGATDVAAFTGALLRVKQSAGLYQGDVATISFNNKPLFSGKVHFPANVPTGTYSIKVLLLRDGEVAGAQTIPLQISKGGSDAWVYDRAHDQAAAYGLCAIVGALLLGWAAHLVFRKI
jgi:uncharacterized protein (TIGR02186 family)